MSSVLVDACGWIALVDARLNLDSAMAAVAGAPRLIVLDAVQAELDRVAGQRGGMLLDLLARRSESMADLDGLRHSDDMLVELSRSEEHTSELQSRTNLVCRLLLEKKKKPQKKKKKKNKEKIGRAHI